MKYAVTPSPSFTNKAGRDDLKDFQACICANRKEEATASLLDASPSRPVKYPNETLHLILICDHCSGFVADMGLWNEELYESLVKTRQKLKNQKGQEKNIPWHLYALVIFSVLFILWLIVMTTQLF